MKENKNEGEMTSNLTSFLFIILNEKNSQLDDAFIKAFYNGSVRKYS